MERALPKGIPNGIVIPEIEMFLSERIFVTRAADFQYKSQKSKNEFLDSILISI